MIDSMHQWSSQVSRCASSTVEHVENGTNLVWYTFLDGKNTFRTPFVFCRFICRSELWRCSESWRSIWQWAFPVMLNEAKISRPRPRPRPGSRGRGRDRGQSFEVKAEANFLTSRPRPRPKIVMNKKYQMIVDNIQANLCHYDQNDIQFNFSFSFAQ